MVVGKLERGTVLKRNKEVGNYCSLAWSSLVSWEMRCLKEPNLPWQVRSVPHSPQLDISTNY